MNMEGEKEREERERNSKDRQNKQRREKVGKGIKREGMDDYEWRNRGE